MVPSSVTPCSPLTCLGEERREALDIREAPPAGVTGAPPSVRPRYQPRSLCSRPAEGIPQTHHPVFTWDLRSPVVSEPPHGECSGSGGVTPAVGEARKPACQPLSLTPAPQSHCSLLMSSQPLPLTPAPQTRPSPLLSF
ncbi:unnamed protein product [Rangifer tarandus platyrhynchus]|uniref:Uncharacterized protein n=1 Tax=Rangifer tarandus platyrhynchus TaxID=3082113 RepID=A0ACB1MK25_RANTA